MGFLAWRTHVTSGGALPFAAALGGPAGQKGPPMRVLVVDDDASLRQALRRALSLEGYEVELAADGLEALAFFRDERPTPDAVVLDVLMPTLDGWETCRAIRQRSNVPVLMLTARDAIEDRVD